MAEVPTLFVPIKFPLSTVSSDPLSIRTPCLLFPEIRFPNGGAKETIGTIPLSPVQPVLIHGLEQTPEMESGQQAQ